MSKILILSSLLFVTSFTINAQESTWKIDPNHSKINFDISYFKVGTIKGSFDNYSGSFVQKKDALSQITINIKSASINTNQKDRDKHLRTSDFFGTEAHPEIIFISTSITKTSDKVYKIIGDFTMTGITKSIVLKGIDKGSYVHPRFKTNNKFITITGIIKREDFKVGTNYPPAKFALGKEVHLIGEIHLIEEK